MPFVIPILQSVRQLSYIKLMMILLSIFSLIAILKMDYNADFWPTSLLPIFYLISTLFFIDRKFITFGIGSFGIVIFYACRMCIFPVVLAYGNFYFEPSQSIYIDKYLLSVLLMGFETFIVFGSARYFILKRYINYPFVNKTHWRKHSIICLVIFVIIVLTFVTFSIKDIDYYHSITEEATVKFIVDGTISEKQSGALWYLCDYLSGLLRILLSAYLVYYFAHATPKKLLLCIAMISLLNSYFLTDRRIYALLVSIFILFYYLNILSSRKTKFLVEVSLLCLVGITAYYFLYNYAQQGGAEMIARTLQRYFSGPSLSALALTVNETIDVVPSEFFKLLFNDFQSLSGIFGMIPTNDFVGPLYAETRGIWTPFVPGALRYFGLFFPIPLICCVWCIVKWDCLSRRNPDLLYSMIYSYISFCISFYLIMYTIELVFYFIIATGLVLSYLVRFDERYLITLRERN